VKIFFLRVAFHSSTIRNVCVCVCIQASILELSRGGSMLQRKKDRVVL